MERKRRSFFGISASFLDVSLAKKMSVRKSVLHSLACTRLYNFAFLTNDSHAYQELYYLAYCLVSCKLQETYIGTDLTKRTFTWLTTSYEPLTTCLLLTQRLWELDHLPMSQVLCTSCDLQTDFKVFTTQSHLGKYAYATNYLIQVHKWYKHMLIPRKMRYKHMLMQGTTCIKYISGVSFFSQVGLQS